MTDQGITDEPGLDDREWFAHGVWVAAPTGDDAESLTMCRSREAAAEVVRDHNALVREVARLRGVVQAVEALHFARGRNILGRPVCNECSPLQPMPCPTLRAVAAAEGLPVPTEPHEAAVMKALVAAEARIEALEGYCRRQAMTARARGYDFTERAFLDALIVSERAALNEPDGIRECDNPDCPSDDAYCACPPVGDGAEPPVPTDSEERKP